MRRIFYVLLALTLLTACVPQPQQVTATPQVTVTSTPKPTETATPIPLVEILPRVMAKVDGFNAVTKDGIKYTSFDGKWAKLREGAKISPMTETEFNRVKSDLEKNGFAVNPDGTVSHNGKLVEGLKVSKENIIFNFNGEGDEIYSARNIRVKNGIFDMGAYRWLDSGAWGLVEYYGFPDNPEKLGINTREDLETGNMARQYVRQFKDLAEKNNMSVDEYRRKVFEGALNIDFWTTGNMAAIQMADKVKVNIVLPLSSGFEGAFPRKPQKGWSKTKNVMLPMRSLQIFERIVSKSGEEEIVATTELLNKTITDGTPVDTSPIFLFTNMEMVKSSQQLLDIFKASYGLAIEKDGVVEKNRLNINIVTFPIIYLSGDTSPFIFSNDTTAYINQYADAKMDAIASGNLDPSISMLPFADGPAYFKTVYLMYWGLENFNLSG